MDSNYFQEDQNDENSPKKLEDSIQSVSSNKSNDGTEDTVELKNIKKINNPKLNVTKKIKKLACPKIRVTRHHYGKICRFVFCLSFCSECILTIYCCFYCILEIIDGRTSTACAFTYIMLVSLFCCLPALIAFLFKSSLCLFLTAFTNFISLTLFISLAIYVMIVDTSVKVKDPFKTIPRLMLSWCILQFVSFISSLIYFCYIWQEHTINAFESMHMIQGHWPMSRKLSENNLEKLWQKEDTALIHTENCFENQNYSPTCNEYCNYERCGQIMAKIQPNEETCQQSFEAPLNAYTKLKLRARLQNNNCQESMSGSVKQSTVNDEESKSTTFKKIEETSQSTTSSVYFERMEPTTSMVTVQSMTASEEPMRMRYFYNHQTISSAPFSNFKSLNELIFQGPIENFELSARELALKMPKTQV